MNLKKLLKLKETGNRRKNNMNKQNEELSIIRRQKKVMVKCCELEKDPVKIEKIKNKIDQLTVKEKELLKDLL